MLKYIQHDEGQCYLATHRKEKSTRGSVDELFAICHHQNTIFSLLLSQEQEFLILNPISYGQTPQVYLYLHGISDSHS